MQFEISSVRNRGKLLQRGRHFPVLEVTQNSFVALFPLDFSGLASFILVQIETMKLDLKTQSTIVARRIGGRKLVNLPAATSNPIAF